MLLRVQKYVTCFSRRPSIFDQIVLEKFKTPVGPADHDDDGASNEMDPQKLFDYCMQITKQFNLKKYKYVERPRADRRGSDHPITSDVSESQSENESSNQSCPTASTDPTAAEDGDPNNSLVSNVGGEMAISVCCL